MTYRDTYAAWKSDPEAYWMDLARDIDWITPPTHALNALEPPFYEWFADAECNTCFNCVDRHVLAGYGDQTAIIHDSPITGTKRTLSFHELRDAVASLGGALQSQGVTKGDRVIIYMPMVPEAVIGMLACARIGAVHSVVFGGFAAKELAVRIDDSKPKAILAASCGVEPGRIVDYKPLLDEAIVLSEHKPEFCAIFQRPESVAELLPDRDLDWMAFQEGVTLAECVAVGAMDPLYILYTSGTTGKPKGVIRSNGGYLVSLNWSMKNFYNVSPGEVFWAASDVGWVVGHSYIVYAPLIARNTTVVFEGKPVGTPDAGTFWRVIEEHDVKVLFTAPTAIRAIKREDPKGLRAKDYDLSGFRHLFLAGERADPDTIKWAGSILNVEVIDHWWQTETGFAITGIALGLGNAETRLGSSGQPMPGYDIRILGEDGSELPAGELGAVAARLPLPPGTFPTLWNASERYVSSYMAAFPGYYETGDAGYVDEDGYLYIMARTDDVINVAGHRLSTGAMEEVLSSHADVAECAVIGVADPLKGQLPLGFLCLNAGCTRSEAEIAAEAIALVRSDLGPVAAFKHACTIERLPKTRSGKILRSTMQKIADGEEFSVPATIDDPAVLDEIAQKLHELGFPK